MVRGVEIYSLQLPKAVFYRCSRLCWSGRIMHSIGESTCPASCTYAARGPGQALDMGPFPRAHFAAEGTWHNASLLLSSASHHMYVSSISFCLCMHQRKENIHTVNESRIFLQAPCSTAELDGVLAAAQEMSCRPLLAANEWVSARCAPFALFNSTSFDCSVWLERSHFICRINAICCAAIGEAHLKREAEQGRISRSAPHVIAVRTSRPRCRL
jgi:hypothetical protein